MKLQDLMEASTIERIKGIPLIDSDEDGIIDFTKMKHAGSGIEGDVYFSKNGNKVVKAVRLRYENDIGSSPFVEFVGLCLKHQDNPYFPKIHNAKIYKIKQRNEKHVKGKEMNPVDRARRGQRQHLSSPSPYIMTVVMEPLTPIKRSDKDKVEQIFNRLGISLDDGNPDHEHMNKIGKFEQSTEWVMDHTKDPHLRDALTQLSPLFKKHGGDLHLDNWMMRGDQIVIVDPLQPFLD